MRICHPLTIPEVSKRYQKPLLQRKKKNNTRGDEFQHVNQNRSSRFKSPRLPAPSSCDHGVDVFPVEPDGMDVQTDTVWKQRMVTTREASFGSSSQLPMEKKGMK